MYLSLPHCNKISILFSSNSDFAGKFKCWFRHFSCNLIPKMSDASMETEKSTEEKVTNNTNSNNDNKSNQKSEKLNQGSILPRLKILALHGYRQNAKLFKQKSGSFRKAVSKYAQFTFITAPHVVINDDGIEDGNSWWFNAEDNTFSGKCLGGPAIGFEQSLSLIDRVITEYGPFDGVMGFSQGACLAGLIAVMQQKAYIKQAFKFVILASGFCSGSLVHKGFYDEDINLPSLHVFGESDSIIPKEMSEALVQIFVDSTYIEHSGGHYLACSGSVKEAYIDFLKKQQELLLQDKENINDKI